MAAMPDVIINVVTLEGAAFKVASGDTLVITSPRLLTSEQRANIRAAVESGIPDGVRVLIVDGGLTVSAITQA